MLVYKLYAAKITRAHFKRHDSMPRKNRAPSEQQVTTDILSPTVGTQLPAPSSPQYAPAPSSLKYAPAPSSPKYAPAPSSPVHARLSMADGRPCMTVATWVWDGDRSPDEDEDAPKYTPAPSSPVLARLCMVGGRPWKTVATSVWDGDRSPDEDEDAPPLPVSAPTHAPPATFASYTRPASPTYAPALV